MKLKKLTLHNYKQHEHIETVFSGNIIGIVGRNGSGKSNLLGGLQFAFAGEQPGFKKSDLLRWGTDEGYVELEFEHNGLPGKICRSLVANSATYVYGDQTFKGIVKVGEGIQQTLGIDKDLSKQAIFVRQAEIDAILFEDPRERELAFQKLCGIGDAAKIYKRLGEELAKLAVPPNYDFQIAEANTRYSEMQARLQQLQATAQSLADQRQKLPNLTEVQNCIVIQRGAQALFLQEAKLRTALDNQRSQATKAQEELDRLPSQTTSLEYLEQEIGKLEKSLALAEDFERKAHAWEAAGKSLMALGTEPGAPELPFTDAMLQDLAQKAEAYRKAYSELQMNYRQYTDLAKALQNTNTTECPVCGGPITDFKRIQDKVNYYKQQLASLTVNYPEQEVEARRKQERVKSEYAERLTRYKTQFTTLAAQYQKAEEAMQAAPKVEKTAEVLRQMVYSLRSDYRAATTTLAVAARCKNIIETCESQYRTLHSELAEVTNSLNKYNIKSSTQIDEALIALNAQVTAVRELDQQLATLNGMIAELANNIKSLEGTIKLLEEKRAGLGNYLAAVKTLTSVRDWFHYSQGPHTLATAVLTEMNQDVNSFLAQFAAPFSVIQGDETLGFRCIFHDGRNMPAVPPEAYHLSGGQKIQLAIAFRFAAYCMFANKLGLLSLDEPTVYLDSQNIGAFCTLLQKVKEVAQKMDLQVLIATHECAVMPFIDTVINLSE